MRLPAVLLLAALLAGCATPAAEEDEDPLFGLCPQWLHGPGEQATGFHLPIAGAGPPGNASAGGNASAPPGAHEVELGPAAAEHEGHPLDLYRVRLLRLEVDGRLELRAFDADGRQMLVRDYRREAPQLVPVVVFTDGSAAGHEFEVFLAPITADGGEGGASRPPVTLQWTLDGTSADVETQTTFHYKVCSAVAQD